MSYAIEIISIGNEVLSGVTINTNSTFLSKEIVSLGLDVQRHQVISDTKESITTTIKEAFMRSDLILSTGGLGPTIDDITKETVSELFDSKLEYSEEVAKDLISRYGKNLTSLNNQATVPSKALILKNSVGTAPGLVFEKNGKTLILMPGVPSEMHTMWKEEVLPYIKKILPKATYDYQRISFVRLREVDLDPTLRELKLAYPEIDFGIYPSLGHVTVSLKGSIGNPNIEIARAKIIAKYPTQYFESKEENIAEAIQKWMVERGSTMAFAESCTGGMLGSEITHIAGSSSYFLGSLVAYSNEIKEKVLNVPPNILQSYGAVSAEVAESMAQNCLKLFKSDFAISVTGIAGPGGGSSEKPVGLIFYSIASKTKEPYTWSTRFRGTREMVMKKAVNEALGVFWMKVQDALYGN